MIFIENHGWGFALHILGAVAIMLIGWWTGWIVTALIINTVLWPCRELRQKDWQIQRTLTFHVFLEWVPAVAVGFVIYGVFQ